MSVFQIAHPLSLNNLNSEISSNPVFVWIGGFSRVGRYLGDPWTVGVLAQGKRGKRGGEGQGCFILKKTMIL
jgi:hypothetical protein